MKIYSASFAQVICRKFLRLMDAHMQKTALYILQDGILHSYIPAQQIDLIDYSLDLFHITYYQ